MNQLRDKLTAYGLTPRNLYTGLVIHEAMGISIFFGAWFCCYKCLHFKSSEHVFVYLSRHPKYNHCKDWVEKRTAPFQRRFSKVDTEKLIISGGLSMIARKILSPILVPSKIILTVLLVKVLVDQKDVRMESQ